MPDSDPWRGPLSFGRSDFSAVESLANHSTDYGRLIDHKTLTRKPLKRGRSDNRTDGD